MAKLKKKPAQRAMTPKQLKFIAFYDGNGTDAARKAGYNGDDNVLGVIAFENLRNPKIVKAIKLRTDKDIEPLIATRLVRQKFWSKVLASPYSSMKDRLKASELLGKSEADFVDVVRGTQQIKTEIKIVNEAEVEAAVNKFNEKFK